MSLVLDPAEAPRLSRRAGVRLVAAGPGLWRVIERSGHVSGHLRADDTDQGVRYRALRFHPVSRGFRELGRFWSAEDAVDCLSLVR